MPTTLTGLLLFVVLLLPGFAYLVGKERNGTERHTSPFRETVAIVAASVASEITILILFAIVRSLRPSWTPDVGALVRGGSVYFRHHYREFAIWGTAMLLLSVGLAYAATMPSVRRLPQKIWLIKKLPLAKPYPHDSTVSAWWLLFERWAQDYEVDIGCALDDGSYIRGNLATFNNSADDAPDRELVLMEPIRYRAPGRRAAQDYPASAVCVSASRIVAMFVNYEENATVTSSSAPSALEGPAAGVSAAASSAGASAPVPPAPSQPSSGAQAPSYSNWPS
jgi:hypothetical protein